MKVRPSVKPMCDKCKSSKETAELWLFAPSILTINSARANPLETFKRLKPKIILLWRRKTFRFFFSAVIKVDIYLKNFRRKFTKWLVFPV